MITIFYGETGGNFVLPTHADAVSGYLKLIGSNNTIYTVSGEVQSGELSARKRDVCYFPVGRYTALVVSLDNEGSAYISEADVLRIDYRFARR
jgi:hypothetical protein